MENLQQININDSVISENINEISSDILEVGLDEFMNSGLLKDIPFVGLLNKIYSLVKNISDWFLLKKVLKFLYQLKDIPIAERIDFVKELEKEKQSKKIGEKLLVYINRLDDINKAEIIGKLYKALIQKKISLSDFFRLTSYVDKSFIDDLINLQKSAELPNRVSIETKENLSQIGLFSRKIKDNRDIEEYRKNKYDSSTKIAPSFDYEINRYGKLLLEYGL